MQGEEGGRWGGCGGGRGCRGGEDLQDELGEWVTVIAYNLWYPILLYTNLPDLLISISPIIILQQMQIPDPNTNTINPPIPYLQRRRRFSP